MYQAKHPITGGIVSVIEYIKDFGTDAGHDFRAKCPICNDVMKIVPRVGENQHFSHINSFQCPTKSSAYDVFRSSVLKNPDTDHAKILKKFFRDSWEKHYIKLKDLVPYLSVNEFIMTLKKINEYNVWSYANIQYFQLPYIMAAIIDFDPRNGILDKDTKAPLRKYYFRFWFDSSISSFDDFYSNKNHAVTFWRASYSVLQVSKKPRIDDIVKFYQVEYSDTFLHCEHPPVQEFVRNKIDKWILNYLL